MKREEITRCAACGRALMHGSTLFFHRIKVERMVGIANVFSTEEDIAKPLGESATYLICDECIAENLTYINILQAEKEEYKLFQKPVGPK